MALYTIKSVRNLQRWWQVQAILLRYGFDTLVDQKEIKKARSFLRDELKLPLSEIAPLGPPEERVRLMLQELGPTYVKLGQMLASRSDLLPENWIAELSKLQSDVAPFPSEQVEEIILAELGQPPDEIFAAFERQPMAAASIGQVHRALLPDGQPVVIKVQRPGIEPDVAADIAIMRELARIAENRTTWGRRYGVASNIEEFTDHLADELDYLNEASNTEQLRRNLAAIPEIRVPLIYKDLTTSRVLTMEQVQGVKINQVAALEQAGLDRKNLALVFVQSLCQQILIDGFFHGDPHPGNVFVDLENGELIFIDLGMMGRLIEEQRTELTYLVLAIQQRDSRELVRVALTIGATHKPVQKLALRRDLDQLLNRYLGASLSEVSIAQILDKTLGLLFDYGIQMPAELFLAVKALVQAEEVARTLDPDIQITDVVQTIGKQLTFQQLDPRTLLPKLTRSLRELARLSAAFPDLLEQLINQIQSGKLMLGLDIPNLGQHVERFSLITNRLTASLVLAGMLVGSAVAMGVSPDNSWAFIPLLGVIGFITSMGFGTVLVSWILLDIWRGRK